MGGGGVRPGGIVGDGTLSEPRGRATGAGRLATPPRGGGPTKARRAKARRSKARREQVAIVDDAIRRLTGPATELVFCSGKMDVVVVSPHRDGWSLASWLLTAREIHCVRLWRGDARAWEKESVISTRA